MTEERAREALEAQGFREPAPMLIAHVADALAREQEGRPAGVRTHEFDYAALLADTPELVDRTEGRLTDPGTETSYVLADVSVRRSPTTSLGKPACALGQARAVPLAA
jgi:hypothetical protein